MSSSEEYSILELIAIKLVDSIYKTLKLRTTAQLQAQITSKELEIQQQEEKEKALYRVISKIRAS